MQHFNLENRCVLKYFNFAVNEMQFVLHYPLKNVQIWHFSNVKRVNNWFKTTDIKMRIFLFDDAY